MFHWNIFTTADATRVVLTVPIHYMLLFFTLPVIFVVFGLSIKVGHAARNYGLLVLILLAYGYFGYGSALTLDRSTGKAVLREFEFYHWTAKTYNLDHVAQIYVATGATTSQLRMQFNSGQILSLSFMDQYGGKEEVARKANKFLAGPPARNGQ